MRGISGRQWLRSIIGLPFLGHGHREPLIVAVAALDGACYSFERARDLPRQASRAVGSMFSVRRASRECPETAVMPIVVLGTPHSH